jgi:hypothetical protein
MAAIGVILGILILAGAVGAFFYFGYDFLHHQLDLNIFISIIILLIIFMVVPNLITRYTK